MAHGRAIDDADARDGAGGAGASVGREQLAQRLGGVERAGGVGAGEDDLRRFPLTGERRQGVALGRQVVGYLEPHVAEG